MNKSRTRLEGFLFWWLVSNLIIVATLVMMSAVLPPWIANITLMGTTSVAVALLVFIPICSALIYLTGKMREPTSRILMIWAFLYFLGIVRIEWSGGIWNINPLLALRFPIVDNASVLIELDVVAFAIFTLFAIAWHRRASRQIVPTEAADSCVPLS